jgi:hypothetical protein
MTVKYSTTHKNIPLYITVNKKWWQFWRPKEIQVMVSATVNIELGVALAPTWCSYNNTPFQEK